MTLDANGGSVGTTSLSATRTTSYSFSNWNTKSNGSGTSYESGQEYTTDADATLYAQWTASTSTAAVTLPTPTRENYDFKGWATSSGASDGSFGLYTPSGNVKLYAIWEVTIADSGNIGSVKWSLDKNGALTISGNGSMGASVSGTAWTEHYYSIKTVTILPGVTNIADDAFDGCFNLKSITIPSSVTSIGSFAFAFCKNLESVTVPEGVTSIGWFAFYHCDCLAKLKLPASYVPDWNCAITDCARLTSAGPSGNGCSIEYAWKGNIPDYAFSGCDTLTSVTIPSGVTSIGVDAFEDCKALTSVTMPSSLTSIGDEAFKKCSSLTDAALPSGLKNLGEQAFCDCSSLKSITIPSGVTALEYRTFNGCSGLTHVTVPASVTSIGMACFDECASLTSAGKIGSGCDYEFGWTESIPDNAFEGCSGLTKVTIPASVTSIGAGAFYGCGDLVEIEIPANVNSIGNAAFSGCGSLESVVIPAGVQSIGRFLFGSCGRLTSITVPESVTSVGENAFYYCYSLTDVYYGGSYAEWVTMAMEEGNRYLTSATLHIPASRIEADLILPADLTEIGEEAFMGDNGFSCVKLPEYTVSVGCNAFANCQNLEAIYIPYMTDNIHALAFGTRTEMTIYGQKGSYAQTYAQDHDFVFVAVP